MPLITAISLLPFSLSLSFSAHFPLLSLCVSAGLKQIHALSIQGNYELRIDLEDFENSTAFAQYGMFGVGLFSVDPEDDGYLLTIGDYTGTAGEQTQNNSPNRLSHSASVPERCFPGPAFRNSLHFIIFPTITALFPQTISD